MILHIDSADRARAVRALDDAEQLLIADRNEGQTLQLEVIANAEALGILLTDSPYAQRIREIATRYDNVSFLACGRTVEKFRLKNGMQAMLLPEVRVVSAALEQIVLRLRQGWTYVKA